MLKVKSMEFGELIKARAKIELEIAIRIAQDQVKMMKALNDMRAKRPTKGQSLKGKKLPPRYRNPKNPEETWAGRGLKPRWIVSAIKAGRKLEAFAIK